jgi:hypothetical protein
MAAALADRSPLITLSARSGLSRFNRLRSEMVDSRLDGRKEAPRGGGIPIVTYTGPRYNVLPRHKPDLIAVPKYFYKKSHKIFYKMLKAQ